MADTTTRARDGEILVVERPEVMDSGSLRLIGFPSPYRPVSVERRPLEARSYAEAIAVSLPSGGSGRKDVGGAYESDGRLIVETERAKPLQKWWPTPRLLPATVAPELRLEGRSIYGGRYVGHFGHVLLETMTRFWADLDYDSYDHFVFIPKFFGRKVRLDGLFQKFTELVGVPADKITVALADGVRLEHLDVPAAPFELAMAADPRFLDVFDRIADRTVAQDYSGDLTALPAKIYLSRSQLDDGRPKGQSSARNELEAEEFFSEQGFEIVHPQKLPFSEQMALARNADLIAGCNGSALHLAMFSRPGTGLLALDIRHVSNQYLIDQARGLDAVHVWARADDDEDWQSPWTLDLQRVRSAYELLLSVR